MSRLEEMIQELCPDGVEYKTVGVLANISRGRVISKDYIAENAGEYPVYSSQTENEGELGKISTYDFEGEYLTWTTDGANAGSVFYRNGKFSVTNVCGLINCNDNEILTRYMYHYLSKNAKSYVSSGMGNPKLMSNVMARIKVAVPPLEVQREIICILDSFTQCAKELTDTLTEEIINRKKQYEYYRDKLLTVEESFHSEKLKSISKISRGVRVTKSQLSDEGFPVYQNSLSPMGHYSEFNVLSGTTYIITAGAAGEIGFSNEDFWAADDCIVLTELKGVTNRYLYHFLMTKKEYIKSRVRKASIPRLSKEVIENLIVPVPSMEVQNKIINTLDNFDAVCSNLNIDVSSEIEARQKQYEYYRDLLLTFAETGNTILTDRQTDRQTIIKLIQYVFGYAPVKIGDIATIIRGGNFQKKDFVENGKPCIHYGQMYTHFGIYADKTLTYLNDEVFAKSKIAKPGDIVMAVTSENVEDVCSCTAWLGNEEIAVSGHTAIISHNQNAKYLSYYFHSAMFYKQKKKLAHGTKVIEVTPSKLADIEIMLPTLEEQERIVSILDRFDSLCNDLTSGLPAEIEARQKQYEYYRDKLLSFK